MFAAAPGVDNAFGHETASVRAEAFAGAGLDSRADPRPQGLSEERRRGFQPDFLAHEGDDSCSDWEIAPTNAEHGRVRAPVKRRLRRRLELERRLETVQRRGQFADHRLHGRIAVGVAAHRDQRPAPRPGQRRLGDLGGLTHRQAGRDALDARGIRYEYLDGSTPSAERERRVAAFQSGAADLFLISLRAGGTGLNMTAADYVVHLDPWWNPAVEDQASDRAHRIGQERPVTIYRLIMQNSIEERILCLHRDKRDLASGLLEGAEAAARLNEEELLDLIRA